MPSTCRSICCHSFSLPPSGLCLATSRLDAQREWILLKRFGTSNAGRRINQLDVQKRFSNDTRPNAKFEAVADIYFCLILHQRDLSPAPLNQGVILCVAPFSFYGRPRHY